MDNNENNGNNENKETPPYEQFQQYQTPPPPPMQLQPHRGTMILVFGIVGLVACQIFGILAWIFGNEDLKKMEYGQMDPSGRDLTNIGRILGIISVGLIILGIVFGLVYFFFFMGVMGAAASDGLKFFN
ncbi:MAG: hypothetical protein K0B87_01050 [Candidatus Syntrophosphaera sp.]|nr:hypothetical protein [Candidatus Syntrophosphaera sp.]